MKNRKKWVMLLAVASAFVVSGIVLAGDLEPTSAPTDSGSAMYTIDDIYNRLNDNTAATKRSGAFTEPSSSPASTTHTLDEVYEKALPTQVPKTGQTTSYRTGDDGDEEPGVASPITRFTDNSDGTIKDNLTGLIWLKQANYNNISGTTGTAIWNNAIDFGEALASGSCGLTDGSSAGDWRLPSVKELHSLIDFENYGPALPTGHPFVSVQSSYYWSGTTYKDSTDYAWGVHIGGGNVDGNRGSTNYVWPVRNDN